MCGQTVKLICHCGNTYIARIADINRGWGLSCSKSCAAIKRDFGKPHPRYADSGDAVVLTKEMKRKRKALRTGRGCGIKFQTEDSVFREQMLEERCEYGRIFASGDAGHGQS